MIIIMYRCCCYYCHSHHPSSPPPPSHRSRNLPVFLCKLLVLRRVFRKEVRPDELFLGRPKSACFKILNKNKESLLSDLKQVCLQAVTDHWQENFFIDLYSIFFSSTVFARLIKIQMCRHPGGRSCDFDTGFFFGDVVRVDAIGWLSKG